MKKIILISCLALVTIMSYGQQETQYTQFMYNKLMINPAYAGSSGSQSLSALYRNQWIGLNGAPVAQVLSFDTPLMNNRVGLGATLSRNTIGINERYTVDVGYAYRIPVGEGYLGIGLQTSLRYFSNNYSDSRLVGTRPISGDGAIPQGTQTKFIPNFGTGIYYNTKNYYVGVSIPRIILNRVTFADVLSTIGKEVPHVYLMGGGAIDLGDNLQLHPQVLVKYVPNTPLDADLNMNAVINSKFIAGFSYRMGGSGIGESVALILGAKLTDNIDFTASYDFTLSEIRDYSSGGLEVGLRFYIKKSDGDDISNPRFF